MYYSNPYFQNVGYTNQGMQPFPTVQPLQSQPQQNNGIMWVQGIEGAKAYQLPPNSNVILMDSDDSKFYIKSTDNVGMATLKTFKFEEITNSPSAQNNTQDFVTRDDFVKLKSEIGEYINTLFNNRNGVTADLTNAAITVTKIA